MKKLLDILKAVALGLGIIQTWRFLKGDGQELKTEKCLKGFAKKRDELKIIKADADKLVPQLEAKKDEVNIASTKDVKMIHARFDAIIKKINDLRFSITGKKQEKRKKALREINRQINRAKEESAKAKGAVEVFDKMC